MSWAGGGALIAWHDVEQGHEVEYEDWHAHEHMGERLSVAGFREGRRYSVVGDGPRFLILYHVEDFAVFTSPDYLERLNDPSEWTRRIMPRLLRMNRSLCRVAASQSVGAGRFLQTTRFSPAQGREAELRQALGEAAGRLARADRLCAAHLLVADRQSSGTVTSETVLRGGADEVADWVLLVEGFDEEAVAEDRGAALVGAGAQATPVSWLYLLGHIATR